MKPKERFIVASSKEVLSKRRTHLLSSPLAEIAADTVKNKDQIVMYDQIPLGLILADEEIKSERARALGKIIVHGELHQTDAVSLYVIIKSDSSLEIGAIDGQHRLQGIKAVLQQEGRDWTNY